MNNQEFRQLVKQMRDAQRAAIATPCHLSHSRAMELERRVDAVLDKQGQGDLFTDKGE